MEGGPERTEASLFPKEDNIHFLSSFPFSSGLIRQSMQTGEPSVLRSPWYAVGEFGIIARRPLAGLRNQWSPAGSDISFQWADHEWNSKAVRSHAISDMELRAGDTVFDPAGGVCLVGKTVLSDSPRFAVPGEADWLIWERDGEKSRLCKMHDGKWSIVRDAPCADVPGVIVVNNDENIVFLSFSLKFDDGDVDASMRRVVTHLREHGALHLNRLKVPVPDPDEGLSEFEKSCREDAARQARLIEENRRRNAEELARLDAERAAANHEAEAAWLAKQKEDAIRKNSRTAGMHTGSGLSPEEIDVRLPKKAIADAILQWPKEGTEFFLTYENKQCYRDGKMDMPMRHAFVFGLVPANVLFSPRLQDSRQRKQSADFASLLSFRRRNLWYNLRQCLRKAERSSGRSGR